MKPQKIISIITSVLVTLLSIAPFVLSYDNLRKLAEANGIEGWLSYLFPLCLDAFMAAASLVVLWRSLDGERTEIQRVLVFLAVAASIGFNAVHAPNSVLGRVIFAVPPLIFFLALEMVVVQISYVIRKKLAIETLATYEEAKEQALADIARINKEADAIVAKPKPIASQAEFLSLMERGNGSSPQGPKDLIAMGIPSSTAYSWWAKWEKQNVLDATE